MTQEIHVGDIGTSFELQLKDGATIIDVSGATSAVIVFYKPNKSVVAKNASLVTDGTDGKIAYVTQSGDLDTSGTWKLQAEITLPSGSWHSDIHSFTVAANLR